MNEEEKKAIEFLKEWKDVVYKLPLKTLLNLIEKQQKEIEELKKVIKMVEVYKSYGIPEDAEMVILRKDDFLRDTNNEFISKDKIRELIKEKAKTDTYNFRTVAVKDIEKLLEE